jgi:predicted RNase H-like HicB family nuclease
MKSHMLHYNVIFRPEPDGGFTAVVPSLPGCVSYGHTITEAKKMILDAIEGYVISLQKHNEVVPSDEENFVSIISVSQKMSVNHA